MVRRLLSSMRRGWVCVAALVGFAAGASAQGRDHRRPVRPVSPPTTVGPQLAPAPQLPPNPSLAPNPGLPSNPGMGQTPGREVRSRGARQYERGRAHESRERRPGSDGHHRRSGGRTVFYEPYYDVVVPAAPLPPAATGSATSAGTPGASANGYFIPKYDVPTYTIPQYP